MASTEFAYSGSPDTPFARSIAGAIVGGVMIGTIEFAVTRGSVEFSVLEQVVWLTRLSAHWAIAALPVGVALWAAGRNSGDGTPSIAIYALAVLVGAIAGAFVMAAHGKYIDPGITVTAVGFDMTIEDRFLYGLWQLAFWGGVGATLHAADLRQQRSAVALQQGELARLRSEQRLGEVRLAALHAQVEPEFILATLHAVERLNAENAAASDRVLDALIRFLREATPLLRRSTSTVEQECRLLDLYLRVVGAASGVASDARDAIDPSTGAVVVPPGLLVSLAQQLHGAVNDGPARTELRATVRSGGCNLELSATAERIDRTEALDAFVTRANQRLKLSCGRDASLALHDTSGRLKIVIALINLQGGSP